MKTSIDLFLFIITFSSLTLAQPQKDKLELTVSPKLGKRFERWGVFAKFRPGFMRFTKVNKLVCTVFQLRNQIPAIAGEWRVGKIAYPSLDVGGVVEFYISRRWLTRFDVGDTIIRYGEVSTDSLAARDPISRRGVDIHHNLQVTSGIGFRF